MCERRGTAVAISVAITVGTMVFLLRATALFQLQFDKIKISAARARNMTLFSDA